MLLLLAAGAVGQSPVGQSTQSAPPAAAKSNSHATQAGSSATGAAGSASGGRGAPSDPALAEAKSLVERGLLTQAEANTRRFLDAHPESAEAHYLLGYILFGEIRQQYLGEEKKEGASFRYNDSIGANLAALRDGKARASLAEFSAGARYHPPNAFDLKIVALDYLLLKDDPSAEKWLSASVKLDASDAQAWFYLGRTEYSETKYAPAIEAFAHCLTLEPKNVEAEYNVGLSYEGLGQKDEALQAYQNAIAWQAGGAAKSADPFIALGRLYLSESQAAKAVPYLVQAVAAFPQISLAHEELGKAYSSLNRLPEAQAELEKAAQLSPERGSLRCVLGQVYQRERMSEKAKVEFAQCAALQNAQIKRASSGAQPH
jgi:Flp pilus assembly protein TadD